MKLKLEFDAARFDNRVMDRFLRHVRVACQAFMASPTSDWFTLELPKLPDELRSPHGFKDPRSCSVPLPTRAVLEWISDQARSRPHAVAIEKGEDKLTYAELDQNSNRLGNFLRNRVFEGNERNKYIALYAERSPINLVGLLGILKAGAAVVSMDPGLPTARRDFMMEDAGVACVLCDQAMADKWPNTTQEQLVLDAPNSVWIQAPEAPLKPPSLDSASYLVYTSGTTGKPKGVINTHRGLSNEAVWAWKAFPVEPDERTLHMANLSFDAAFEEIFGTLVGGGTLVCRPPEAMDTLDHFHRALIREKITLLDLTTSFWAQWVAWMDREKREFPPDLRVMVVGGEKTQQSTYSIWQQLAQGRVRWLNTYGPTEAAIVSTVYISPDEPGYTVPMGEVPIGRPLPNTYVRLLDSHRREVPAGASGELYIGGVGVADGYLNRPELTEKAFIQDPLGEESDRLYKTGDLVRMTKEGEIEYLGRADNQVKIRGFRIELDEVENAISSHPSVAESVVVTLTEGNRISGLAAYVVLRDPTFTMEALKSYLEDRLPPYAIPGAIAFLLTLPLTANGKVDRRALPPLSTISSSENFARPETPLEAELERLFAKVLRRERVDIDENFQQAGGDSFQVMELIELAMRAGYPLHPETLIRYPSVRSLAKHLATRPQTEAQSASVTSDVTEDSAGLISVDRTGGSSQSARKVSTPYSPLSVLRDGKQPVLYLAHATPGDVMGYGNLVYHLRKDQAVCGLSSLGLHDLDRAHDSIEAMAGYYVEHLLKHQPNGPYHLGGWCYGGTVAYEMARQLVAQGHEVALLALIDCYAPLPTNLLAKLRYWFRRVQMLWNRSFPGQMAYVRVKLIPGSPQTLVEPKPSDLPKGTHLVNREVVTEKNMAAIRRYTFRPYPASFDVYLSTQVGDNNLFDPTGAWSLFTDKARYHLLEADHRAILKEPAVRLLADHLQAQLDRDRTC